MTSDSGPNLNKAPADAAHTILKLFTFSANSQPIFIFLPRRTDIFLDMFNYLPDLLR